MKPIFKTHMISVSNCLIRLKLSLVRNISFAKPRHQYNLFCAFRFRSLIGFFNILANNNQSKMLGASSSEEEEDEIEDREDANSEVLSIPNRKQSYRYLNQLYFYFLKKNI